MENPADKSSTFVPVDTIAIVATTADVAALPQTSSVEIDQPAQPVASTWDEPKPSLPAPQTVEAYWGLTLPDCMLLLGLAAICLGLAVWHWGQMSGWGAEPVEVNRLPERVYDYRIDLNRATAVELMQLPRIGQSLSARIVEYREQHGPFQSLDELDNVPGIGPKTLEQLRPWLTINESDPE